MPALVPQPKGSALRRDDFSRVELTRMRRLVSEPRISSSKSLSVVRCHGAGFALVTHKHAEKGGGPPTLPGRVTARCRPAPGRKRAVLFVFFGAAKALGARRGKPVCSSGRIFGRSRPVALRRSQTNSLPACERFRARRMKTFGKLPGTLAAGADPPRWEALPAIPH